MAIYKFVQSRQIENKLVTDGYAWLIIGDDLDACNEIAIHYLQALNKIRPDKYKFEPFVGDDGASVRYYENGDHSCGMYATYIHENAAWWYNNNHN